MIWLALNRYADLSFFFKVEILDEGQTRHQFLSNYYFSFTVIHAVHN